MPLSYAELEKYLEGLELLLEGSPDGHIADLTGLLQKLEDFTADGDTEPVEITVRLLGTAVGGQSKIRGYQSLHKLIPCRGMANTISRKRHPCICAARDLFRGTRRRCGKAVPESHWQLSC